MFKATKGDAFILCYMDKLLFPGEAIAVNKFFIDIQQHLMLRPTGDLTIGNTVSFLGRNISNKGDFYEISLADIYTKQLLQEANMQNCNAVPAPGINTLKATSETEQFLTTEEHSVYRRIVDKLPWMTYIRPDISFATKELARALIEPTRVDQQKLKYLLRYIKGTQHYKYYIRPIIRATPDLTPDIGIFVDNAWAGCPTTRKSTTGFIIKFLGSTKDFGSRTQATIVLSSAEAELYAINTGAIEALHIRNILQEALNIKKINIWIHTNSSRSSKKAKHIEFKHLFIQQLVLHNFVRLIKINTNGNTADIFTKYIGIETLLRHLHNAGINTQYY